MMRPPVEPPVPAIVVVNPAAARTPKNRTDTAIAVTTQKTSRPIRTGPLTQLPLNSSRNALSIGWLMLKTPGPHPRTRSHTRRRNPAHR
jgi:hypothetical protein